MGRIELESLDPLIADLRGHGEGRDLDAALTDVARAAASAFAITGCGIMFLDDRNVLRYAASSDEPGRVLETAQEELGHGPCVDSLLLDSPIATKDVCADERWPGLSERVAPHGVRAVLGVPIRAGGGAVGSLNVYRDEPHAWDDSETQALLAFNTLVESLVGSAVLAHQHGRTVQQLQYALDNRVTIERAIGVIMGRRNNLDAVSAFGELRQRARNQRRRVGDVAADILAGRLDL
jgi:GAF domain-containing protein